MPKKNINKNYFIIVSKFIIISSSMALIIWMSVLWENSKKPFYESSIIVNGASAINDTTYLSYINQMTGQRVNDLSKKRLINALVTHPFVHVARVSNRYPSKLIIDIKERKPFALLNKDPMVILDQNCYVLPDINNLEKYDIPVLSKFNKDNKLYPHGEKSLSIKVQNTISWLSSLYDKYPNFYYDISEILLENGDEIVIILNENPTKIFLGNSNTLKKIAILKKFEETIFNSKKITDYAYLDIRYNNQVIAKEF